MRQQNTLNQWYLLTRFTLIFVFASSIACASSHKTTRHFSGRAFLEAETLFHQDPRWLGSDAALSIPLDKNRTLWLFGDTFIALSNSHSRKESEMVRNTIAIQTGNDPSTASISFHWRDDSDGSPASFFPERGERWYWPGHGIRLSEGPLILFLYKLAATSGQGLGFAHAGNALAVINNPDASPEMWKPRITDLSPSSFDAVPASAVVQDGTYIVGVAIRQKGIHAGALVRYPAIQLAHGNTSHAEWWAGDVKGWVPESSINADGPEYILDDAGSECSLHWDERAGSFIHIASYGFGASTIGIRTAPALTGPWSQPVTIYRPPESNGPKPFVYAAKAHPELTGPTPNDLVVTYATNSFEFGDLFTRQGAGSLYWPRFVLVRIDK